MSGVVLPTSILKSIWPEEFVIPSSSIAAERDGIAPAETDVCVRVAAESARIQSGKKWTHE
jgi:hypothetical protein